MKTHGDTCHNLLRQDLSRLLHLRDGGMRRAFKFAAQPKGGARRVRQPGREASLRSKSGQAHSAVHPRFRLQTLSDSFFFALGPLSNFFFSLSRRSGDAFGADFYVILIQETFLILSWSLLDPPPGSKIKLPCRRGANF